MRNDPSPDLSEQASLRKVQPSDPTDTRPRGQPPERPLWPALRRGWQRRCPNCGSGPLMLSYLKVRDSCPVCAEVYSHHRADDGPAYLTILIVGHIAAPALLSTWLAWRPDPMVLFTGFAIGTVALSLYLLPRLKGGLVAFQWARHMHGFAASEG
ncbi:DUF983 domain-containing protein [Pseudooceanicola algae]|uniref:DUF983 domain-containing protein n=1 Tax=Pseudooceanicola algae TaxID=1537215 RepID=A0A418SCG5_9RHOB|nr:DUF983 domain-containing protein [Pseudooceanicola algae]QPM90096.1 hypothetical protein PSAL_013300 [Pseudooceanicola algae]